MNNDHVRLSYEVGCLRGFIKYGLECLSSIEIKDRDAFRAAVDAAVDRIEKEAKEYVANYGK